MTKIGNILINLQLLSYGGCGMKTIKALFIILLIIQILCFSCIDVFAEEVNEMNGERILNVTLEECMAEIVNIFSFEQEKETSENYISIGENRGYLKGIKNRNNNELITRAMLSRIICNVLDLKPVYSKDSLFEDIKEVHNAEYIKAVYLEYLMDSPDEVKFYPDKMITKDELTAILENIKKYHKDTNTYKKEMKKKSSSQKEEKIKKLLSMTDYNTPKDKIAFGTPMGILEFSTSKTFINDYFIPTFSYNNSSMIFLSDLNYYGFDINWDEANKKISIYKNNNKEITGLEDEEVKNRENSYIGKPVIHTNIAVYIGNRKVPCYSVDHSTIIFTNDLNIFGNLNWDNDAKEIIISLKDQPINDELGIELINNKIINYNEYTLDIDLEHIWYDEQNNKSNIVEDSVYGIPSGDCIEFNLLRYDLYEKSYYVGTVIKNTNIKENPFYERELYYYQSKKMIDYTCNFYRNPEEELFSLVKPSIIIGTMKRDAGGFSTGEKVEILYGQDGSWYQCKSVNTQKNGRIPWGSVFIPSDPPTNQQRMTKEQLEAYVRLKGFTSNTNYFVWTDLDRQMTYVFKKENEQWKLLRSMLCSTGKNITPTPRGFFTIKERGAYFGDGYMCKNWVQIWGDYLYHSVLMDVSGTYVLESNVLGKRASHGCIRFSLENSKWFYDTIPRNTTVWIN